MWVVELQQHLAHNLSQCTNHLLTVTLCVAKIKSICTGLQ
jgi:hypothetical protein